MRDLLAGSGEEVFVSTLSLYKVLVAIAIAHKNTFIDNAKVVDCKGNDSPD